MKQYLKIYQVFLKCSLMKQMEYRANFFMMVAIESMFLITKLLYAYVVYDTGVEISGFSADMVIFYIGTFILMTGIYLCLFYFNFSSISAMVREGGLDLLITKPISLQFMLTMKQADFGTPIPNILAGLAIIVYQWKNLHLSTNIMSILGYVFYLVIGSMVGYSIMFAVQLISFYTIKSDAVREVTDNLWDFNNMPQLIYNKLIQRVGTFILPIFIVTNYPVLIALGKINITQFVWGIVACLLLFIAVRALFLHCIKRYASASS